MASIASLASSGVLHADEVQVMATRALASTVIGLVGEFKKTTGHKVRILAAATGVGPESIPSRVRRGDEVDLIILGSENIDALTKEGHILQGSRTDLARSGIGMAIRAGAKRPNIETVDALRTTLVEARSVAYSALASGQYISTTLVNRLGIAEQFQTKARPVLGEAVADVVARGDAEIGFQQTSELLGMRGVDYIGALPAEVQLITVMSAGIGTTGRAQAAARAFITLITSPGGQAAMKANGLDPLVATRR